ncbi:MAG: hypothetical protein R6V05_10530 [Candidatus Brocadiia bacterium]
MHDFRSQIAQSAFMNAQVIQEAITRGELRDSLCAVARFHGLDSYHMINAGHVAALLYCLIVVPWELWPLDSDDPIFRRLEALGVLDRFEIRRWSTRPRKHPLRDFMRHLRNAVAHVRFDIDPDERFTFRDRKSRADSDNFVAYASLEDLAAFLSVAGRELANLRNR